MVNTVNKIPSINLPLTNEQGVIHPIWYEFLRSFISSIGEGETGTTTDNTVLSGLGITGTGAVSTVNVGQGEGILVNANDVAVDIIHQVNAQAAEEDEILIADASDLSRIRKTSLRDVVALAHTRPGGNTTQIQYNNNDEFAGDSGFTTDGAGSVNIVGDLDVDDLNLNGNTITTSSSSTPFVVNVPAGGLNQFLFAQSGAGSSATTMELRGIGSSSTLLIRSDNSNSSSLSDSQLSFATNAGNAEWTMGLYDSQDDDFVLANGTGLNTGTIFTVDRGDQYFAHNTNHRRKTMATITASIVQTQGQGPLTADINEVSTVANANDTVTLPGAQAGSEITVINNGAQTLKIFPASGDNLGAGLNTATTIVSGENATYVAYDSTNWERLDDSGVNTGDQTITLTGDVTGSGTGSFAATIANDAVTYAKMQNVSATDKLLGRSSSGAGDVEEITCTAAGRALIDDASASAQRTTLGLVIGTDVQAYDAELAALAGLTSAADKLPYFTDSGTAALADISSAMRTFMTTSSSANLASLLTDETGSGANVHANTPTLITPVLGAATATSINFGQDSLSYYDVGTFTPVFTFATLGDLSFSYTTQLGTYIRIGDLVFIEIVIAGTPTYTTSSGAMTVTGLPFTVNGTTYGVVANDTNLPYPASRTYIVSRCPNATTTMTIAGMGSSAGLTNLSVTQFVSGTAQTFRAFISYLV